MKNIQRIITFVALLFFGCDPVNLTPIPPEPDAGTADAGTADAGEQFIPRDPPPDAGPSPCDVEFIWDEDYLPLGACRPGVRCGDDFTPPITAVAENCGNGLDDDCDGDVDERDDGQRRAVALVLDGSGSMNPQYTPALTEAICYSNRFENYDWALVVFSNFSRVVTQFEPGTTSLCQALFDMPWAGSMGGSAEFAAEGVRATQELSLLLNTTTNVQLEWPVGSSRSVLIATDEPPQDPGVTNGVPRIRDMCERKFRLDVLTHDAYHADWRTAFETCGGQAGDLSAVPSLVEQELVSLLGTGC